MTKLQKLQLSQKKQNLQQSAVSKFQNRIQGKIVCYNKQIELHIIQMPVARVSQQAQTLSDQQLLHPISSISQYSQTHPYEYLKQLNNVYTECNKLSGKDYSSASMVKLPWKKFKNINIPKCFQDHYNQEIKETKVIDHMKENLNTQQQEKEKKFWKQHSQLMKKYHQKTLINRHNTPLQTNKRLLQSAKSNTKVCNQSYTKICDQSNNQIFDQSNSEIRDQSNIKIGDKNNSKIQDKNKIKVCDKDKVWNKSSFNCDQINRTIKSGLNFQQIQNVQQIYNSSQQIIVQHLQSPIINPSITWNLVKADKTVTNLISNNIKSNINPIKGTSNPIKMINSVSSKNFISLNKFQVSQQIQKKDQNGIFLKRLMLKGSNLSYDQNQLEEQVLKKLKNINQSRNCIRARTAVPKIRHTTIKKQNLPKFQQDKNTYRQSRVKENQFLVFNKEEDLVSRYKKRIKQIDYSISQKNVKRTADILKQMQNLANNDFQQY